MAKGNDESRNPNRRPRRTFRSVIGYTKSGGPMYLNLPVPEKKEQTDEEKMDIIKQVFPNAQEVEGPRDYTDEEETEADRRYEEYSQGFSEHESSRAGRDAEKKSFGDDYNSYKAHEAGNIKRDED